MNRVSITRRLLALGALLALAAVLGGWWLHRPGAKEWRAATDHRELALRVLAEYLSERHPRSHVLIVGNPFTQQRGQSRRIQAFENAAVRGFKKGFTASGSIQVAYPELRPEFDQDPEAVWVDPRTTTPLSFLVAEGAFDQLTQEHPGADMVVSLIGLPVHWRHSELARSENHRLALLLPDWRMVGDQQAVRQAIHSGRIAAAVINRPGAPAPEEESAADYRTEFSRRFLLVTPENIDQLLATHAQLF